MRSLLTVSILSCTLVAYGCGGSVSEHGSPPGEGPDGSTPDASTPDAPHGSTPDASTPDAPHVPPPGETPPQHRPTASACPPSAGDDAGAACMTDTDCKTPVGGGTFCLHGQCGLDQCLADPDCGTSSVCVCADAFYGGNGVHGNVCVAATCHVDSDCGAGGFCIPSQGYCGAFEGFYCHTPADTCVDPKLDCPGPNDSCVYDQTVGHFACATVLCAG
jgi:hypothetical protein